MIALLTLLVGTVFLLAIAANCWLAIREPAAWWAAARTKITAHASRQRLSTRRRKAQITHDAERICQELFDELDGMTGE